MKTSMSNRRWTNLRTAMAAVLLAVIGMIAGVAIPHEASTAAAYSENTIIDDIGSGNGQFSANGGPVDLAVDPVTGFLFVVDYANNRVQILEPDGTYSGQFGSLGGGLGDFVNPIELAFAPDRSLYVTDRDSVQRFTVSYDSLNASWTVTPEARWTSGSGITLANSYSDGIAFYDDDMYILASNQDKVVKFDLSGGFSSSTPAEEWGTSLIFYYPTGIVVDDTGVYITDNLRRVIKASADGSLLASVEFAYTYDIVRSDDGYLYVASNNLGSFARFDNALNLVGRFGTYAAGMSPNGIAIDASGVVYVGLSNDLDAIAIRKYDAGSDNNHLSGLALSDSEGNAVLLNETFDRKTLSYSAEVAHETASLRITPTAEDGSASIAAGGQPVDSGSASNAIALHTGANSIPVVVTAANGASRTYTVTITRAYSTDAQLSDLRVDGLPVSEFDPANEGPYTVNVPYSQTSSSVSYTLSYADATASVSGGTALNVGDNTVTVTVTAEDGTTQKTYTITIHRTAASSDATLANLQVDGNNVSGFDPANEGPYRVNVPHGQTSVTVTYTLSDAEATASVSGGTALNVGGNTVTVTVTAENGTVKTYTILVTRISNHALLSNIAVDQGTLSPAFASTHLNYEVEVPNAVTERDIYLTLGQLDQTLTVTGAVYQTVTDSVYTYRASDLVVGVNPMRILVTAQDGTTTTDYRLDIIRLSNDADLSGLHLSSGTLSPAFESGIPSYSASVPNSVSGLTVRATARDVNASITVNEAAVVSGGESGVIHLNVGRNTIKVEVTAQDGTVKEYSVTVTRAGSSRSDEVGPVSAAPARVIDLNGTTLDPGTIDTAKPSVTLEMTPENGTAYVSIPAGVFTDIADRNAVFIIEIQAPYGSYRVPVNLASLIPGLQELLAANNLKAEDISFKITLTDKSGDSDIQDALANDLPNGKVMGAIVDFHMEIVDTRTKQAIGTFDTFHKAIERMIPMPKEMSDLPEQWGAFRYNETADQFEYVPARKVLIDGIWYVMIRSISNSVYVVVDNPVRFDDMQRHWGKSYVDLAAAKGLVEGVGGGRYSPDKAVTRAEFTAMLVRALGRGTSAGGTAPYHDVRPGAWYFGEVASAKALGLLDFASGNDFSPNKPLTREEMASMLAAAVQLEQLPLTEEEASLSRYKNIGSVDAAYLEDVRLMITLRIMVGTSADTFSPDRTTTRAEAAVVLIKTLQAAADSLDNAPFSG